MNENFTIFVIPFIEVLVTLIYKVCVPHLIWFFQVDIKLYK